MVFPHSEVCVLLAVESSRRELQQRLESIATMGAYVECQHQPAKQGMPGLHFRQPRKVLADRALDQRTYPLDDGFAAKEQLSIGLPPRTD
jgi:hypothetical protein